MTEADQLAAVLRAPSTAHFGAGSVATVPAVAAITGSRPLICTDRIMESTSGFRRVLEGLEGADLAVEVFAEAEPEVPLADVAACAEHARAHGADTVIAFGGGSAIDLAKVTALGLTHSAPLESFYGEGLVPSAVTPIIAIPTTAGTGSEVSPVAVVSDDRRELKVGISSPFLIPTYAVCDPELTMTCPPKLTAHSGIDALSHAIEAYTAAAREQDWDTVTERTFIGKNPISDALALTAVEHIGTSLPAAVEDGRDLAARSRMLLGSTLAGLAFSQAGTSLAHALQYPLGAATHTPHGLGIGALLPYAMRFNLPVRRAELAQLAPRLGVDTAGMNEEESAIAAIDAVAGTLSTIGLPDNLQALGVEREQLGRFADQALGIGRLLDNNPRPVTRSSLLATLEAAWHGDLSAVP